MKTFTYNTHFYNKPEFQATIQAPAGSRFVVIVKAENGDKVVKPYGGRDSAASGVRYYLNKFDKLNLMASGSFYKLNEVSDVA